MPSECTVYRLYSGALKMGHMRWGLGMGIL